MNGQNPLYIYTILYKLYSNAQKGILKFRFTEFQKPCDILF